MASRSPPLYLEAASLLHGLHPVLLPPIKSRSVFAQALIKNRLDAFKTGNQDPVAGRVPWPWRLWPVFVSLLKDLLPGAFPPRRDKLDRS